jgi:hypothetical protein
MLQPTFATVSLADDLERVRAVRQAVGDAFKLMVDAGSTWNRAATRKRPGRCTSSSPRSAAHANGLERQRDGRALP